MIELAVLLAGVALGGGVTWLFLKAHTRAAILAEREGREARLGAAEALVDESRKLLSQRELELADLREALTTARAERAQAEARWEAARQNLEEQRRLLDEARERLGETFRALSADVLRDSGAALVEQARQTIDAQFGRRQDAIDALVKPLREALERYETEVQALEARREQAYGSLAEQLRTLSTASTDLQRETGNLVTALRGSQVRGRWGELTLHRVVELAGMVEHCDYVEQATTGADGARLRPDLVVRLPGGRRIVVDAKVPLKAYLEEVVPAASPEQRRAALMRHAQQVRQHMSLLAGKAYAEEFAQSAEFVVMFIPGEAFVSAAVEVDSTLLEEAMARGVVIASPTTLIALLHAAAYGWRQERAVKNAAEISELGRQLYDRIRTLGKHFDDVGRSLKRATEAYNQTVGSLETRVLPAARRFKDLGAATGEEIPALERVDPVPRQLAAADVSAPDDGDTPE